MNLWNRVKQRLWLLLPDNCERAQWGLCCRKGARGNENIVDGRLLCDYCHAEIMDLERGSKR